MMRDLLNSPLLARPHGFSRSASSRASRSPRKVRFTKSWLGGFNLLPYRQRNARLARRRCLHEWLAAAMAGIIAVLGLAAWQVFEKTRIDAERESIERSFTQMAVPLAEHARLTRVQDERRKATALAASLSVPLTHLRDLLDALSFEPGDGVVLRQLRQREYDTELLATSRGHLASAEWLKRLGAIRGVSGTEMSDLHRPVLRAHAPADESVTGPIEFGARLRWGEPVLKTVRAVAANASRPVKSDISGGTK